MIANNLRSLFPRSNPVNASTSSVVSDITTYTEVTWSLRIVDLISNCRWVALREVLEHLQKSVDDDDDDYEFFPPSILHDEVTNDISSNLILHQAIRNGAPKSVLMLIARHFPETLFQTDDRRRYPLHVACEYGAPSSFIFHCMNVCPDSVGARDKDGRKPAKILCDTFVEMKALERRMIRIASVLS